MKSNKTMSVSSKYSALNRNTDGYYIPNNIDIHWVEFDPLDDLDLLFERAMRETTAPDQILVLWAANRRITMTQELVDQIDQFAGSIANPVLLVNGEYQSADINARYFVYGQVAFYQHNARRVWNQRLRLPDSRNKKLLYMSTKNYPQRRYLLSHILQAGLYDQGYVNYTCLGGTDIMPAMDYTQSQIHSMFEIANSINDQLPLPVIGADPEFGIEWNRTPRKMLLNSYINMITETFYHGGLFISEKPYTAIAHGQMFILLAAPGALAYLRSQGYQTFSTWWDESYDQISSPYDRLVTVTKTFMDLVQRPISELADLYNQARPVLEHNQRHFYAQDTNADFVALLQQARQLKNG